MMFKAFVSIFLPLLFLVFRLVRCFPFWLATVFDIKKTEHEPRGIYVIG